VIWRCSVLTVLFLAAWGARVHVGTPRAVPEPPRLVTFPATLGDWRGRDLALPDDVVQQVAASDYLNRYYAAGDQLASLYIGYYRTQQQGAAIHSPMNCLPGAGWQPQTTERIALDADATDPSKLINKVVIVKGLDHQLVLYWYQTSDRVTASEYWSKAYLVADAFRTRRSDIALVRLIVPFDAHDAEGESKALRLALPLARRIQPLVHTQLFPV
jgi:EpsI family protein